MSSIGGGATDLGVILPRGVEVVVVRGQARLLELARLLRREHAQRGADLHVERAGSISFAQRRLAGLTARP